MAPIQVVAHDALPTVKRNRYARALNLHVYFHMLCLDDELSKLTHTIALLVGRYLERRDLLERDAGNTYLTRPA